MGLKKCILIITTIIISFSLLACKAERKNEKAEKYTKNFVALGTTIEFSIFSDNEKEANLALKDGEKKVNEIENKMSVNIEKSEISTLNSKAYGKVSEETFDVVKAALKYAQLSQGKLDITVEPLVKLWGIGTEHAKIPTDEEINKAKSLINYKKIKLDEKNKTISLDKGQGLDLGAIAKGYTADEIKKVFLKHGIKSGFINLGGNVMTIGNKADGSNWKVGVQNPLAGRDQYIGIIKGRDLSVVTSGNYERYFEKNGVRYHHILDVSTGYPSKSGVISTAIISKYGIDGDALSTSVYVLGVEKGLKLIESLDGVDAIFITEDKKVYTTSKIKDKFEITNDSFKLAN